MESVGELEAQNMLAGRQRQLSFQGRVTVVNVLFVVRDDFAGRDEIGINEDVKMA